MAATFRNRNREHRMKLTIPAIHEIKKDDTSLIFGLASCLFRLPSNLDEIQNIIQVYKEIEKYFDIKEFNTKNNQYNYAKGLHGIKNELIYCFSFGRDNKLQGFSITSKTKDQYGYETTNQILVSSDFFLRNEKDKEKILTIVKLIEELHSLI